VTAAPSPLETVRDSVAKPELWVDLARLCDVRCVFCYATDGFNGTLSSFEDVRAELEFGRSQGRVRVNFSGGEPTLHPKFAEFVRLAKSLGYERVRVTTDGRGFSKPAFCRSSADAGLDIATVSIHGDTAELHEKHTLVRGSFQRCLDAVSNLQAAGGVEVEVSVVLTRHNVGRAEDIWRFFRKRGVSNVVFRQLQPFGDAWKDRETLFLDPAKEPRFDVWKVFELSEDPELRAAAPQALGRQFECMIGAIFAREEAFRSLLRDGTKPFCWGERCSSCMLRRFCADAADSGFDGPLARFTEDFFVKRFDI
jgi:MoaA/NifB/PqqE/SkfB family radical SAM enzyme